MLVRSVLAIAREFGLQVVAEGIESEVQEVQLRRLGCDYGQGCLYTHPFPAVRDRRAAWDSPRRSVWVSRSPLARPGRDHGCP